jgi:hypothetical protein
VDKDMLRREFKIAIRTQRYLRWQCIAVLLGTYCVFLAWMTDSMWLKWITTVVNIAIASYSYIQAKQIKNESEIIDEKIKRIENGELWH